MIYISTDLQVLSKFSAELHINIRFIVRQPKATIKVIYVNYVTLVTDNSPKLPDLVNRLFEILVEHNIIDIQSVRTLLVTFSKLVHLAYKSVTGQFRFSEVPGTGKFTTPGGAKPLTPETVKTTVTISGNPVARNKFYQFLNYIIKYKPADHNPATLAKLLIELLLDNHILTPESVTKLTTTFNIKVTIKSAPAPKPAHPTAEVVHLTYITFVTSSPDSLGPFINKLLELNVNHNILDKPDAERILVTISKFISQLLLRLQ